MARYIVLPVKRDPAEAEEAGYEVVRRQFPQWEPSEGDPMTAVIRANAVMYSDAAELATRMGEEAFRYFGRGVAGLPPVDERAASGQVLVTARDAAGPYVVPEGLEIVGRGPLGEPIAFSVLTAGIVPNGSTTATVTVEAMEEGAQGNSVSGDADFSEFVDYLTAVEFVAPTSGGEDREADEAYLDRLGDEFELFTPRPILPNHFAVLARRFGAFRATALDGLDPSDGSTGNPAMVAVAMIDEAGNPLGTTERNAIAAQLDAMREVGFAVPAFDPEYTDIDVTYTATAYPGWDPAVVEVAADAAVASYLSPARWGIREDTGEDREWLNDPLVRHLEVAERLQRVEGLRFVDSLTIGVSGGTMGTANVTMTGFAPLPRVGAITGSVSPA